MAAFLFSWNPEKYHWDSLRKDIVRIGRKGSLTGWWSCGNRTDLPRGSEFFLMRLGPALKGLVGRGVTASEPYEDKHWDPEKRRRKIKTQYVKVRFTDLREAPAISWDELQQRPLSRFKWNSFTTAVALPQVIVGELDRRWMSAKPGPGSMRSNDAQSNRIEHAQPNPLDEVQITNDVVPTTMDWVEDTTIESHPFAQELADEIRILRNPELSATEKEALIAARRGCGIFRQKVFAVETNCRVTRVDDPNHLIACHIKPWSESSNAERLAENNGLMLAPHLAHLFDMGLISFMDNGDILVSRRCPPNVFAAWGISPTLNVGPFQIGQRPYLAYHRTYCFKP
jgi:HNH endonuclease